MNTNKMKIARYDNEVARRGGRGPRSSSPLIRQHY